MQQIRNDQTLRIGPLEVTAHLTPGHTAGGTSWSWKSCEQARCLNIVYVNSLAPVSRDSFLFTRNATYPNVLGDFEQSFAAVSALPCDILLTPHPEASDLWADWNGATTVKRTRWWTLPPVDTSQLPRARLEERVAKEARERGSPAKGT